MKTIRDLNAQKAPLHTSLAAKHIVAAKQISCFHVDFSCIRYSSCTSFPSKTHQTSCFWNLGFFTCDHLCSTLTCAKTHGFQQGCLESAGKACRVGKRQSLGPSYNCHLGLAFNGFFWFPPTTFYGN